MKKYLVLPVLALLVAPESFAAETIVGRWAQSRSDCEASPVTIKPMEIQGGDVFCYFSRVKRMGELVEWQGHCFADGGTRRPEAGEDGEVRAFYKNGKLQVEGPGFAFPDLDRCN